MLGINSVRGRYLYVSDGGHYENLAHAEKDPRFPHDPIADQFFTDQRFEAYRAIGALAKLPL